MKNIIIILILVLGIVSCTKQVETKQVKYMVTGLSDPYQVVMIDAEGATTSQSVSPVAFDYEWNKKYEIENGEPVYLYIKFKEDIKDSPKFNVGIIIDGKYNYQRKGWDKNIGDSIYEVKISGVVPY